MAATHPFNQTSPDTEAYSRLYLRDEELRFGLASLFEAVSMIKLAGEAARAEYNLSWGELKALISIVAMPDTVLNLCTRLGITKQAFTKTLRNLENTGLIERNDDKLDKRRKIIKATLKGNETHNNITLSMRKYLARTYKQVGAEAVYGFDQVLWALLGNKSILKGIAQNDK